MKKLLFTFALALVAFTANAQSTFKGDVNGDGEVSVTDITMIVSNILGVTTDNVFIASNADINGDGGIDVKDVMLVVDIILKSEEIDYITGIYKELYVGEVGSTYVKFILSLIHPYYGETILRFVVSDKSDMSHIVKRLTYTANGRAGDVTYHNQISINGLQPHTKYYCNSSVILILKN